MPEMTQLLNAARAAVLNVVRFERWEMVYDLLTALNVLDRIDEIRTLRDFLLDADERAMYRDRQAHLHRVWHYRQPYRLFREVR